MDRVKPLKIQDTGDEQELYPQSIDQNEDAMDARGVTLQNDTSDDDAVVLSRDASNNMTFKDGVVSGTKTLSDLLEGEDDDQVEDHVPDGETFTVKENFQHIIYKSFRVAGEYIVRGTAAIIGGDDGGGSGPPEAHASTHENGGSDEIDVAGLSGELADDQPPKAHALGGAKHTSATLAQLNALVSDATLDDSGDSRSPSTHATSHENGGADEISIAGLSGLLADGQTPLSHAASHQSGGADSIKLDDLASPDDNTDLDATTSAHGLLPKLGGGTTNYLRADGNWATPAGGDANTLDGEDGSYYLDHRNFTNLHPVNAQTGTSYTLQDSDNGKLVTLDNASAITLTVPSGLSSDFACALLQKGAGNVTISAGTGVTINNIDSNTTTEGQWALASVTHLGSNVFFTQGRLSS